MPRNFATLGFIPTTFVEDWTISSRKDNDFSAFKRTGNVGGVFD